MVWALDARFYLFASIFVDVAGELGLNNLRRRD